MSDRRGRSARYGRPQNWLIGSDPGLLRLRMATRTTAALAATLLILYLLTTAAGQPMTSALLGVAIAMIAARSVNEADPRRQKVTMALLPVAAAASITAGVFLAPHRVAQDAMFVVIMFVAAYIRRFGSRGTALGMVAFMTYFFGMFLRAQVEELPWLILAIVIGTACSFVMGSYVLPDRPAPVLRRAVQALWVRMAAVIDTTGEAVLTGRLDARRRRRLRVRAVRLNETALMVQNLLEDTAGPDGVWSAGQDELAMRLFDAELAVERVVVAGRLAAQADLPTQTRVAAAGALDQLATALWAPQPDGFQRAAERAERLAGQQVRPLARAITATATACAEVRSVFARTVPVSQRATVPPVDDSVDDSVDEEAERTGGLRPTTRQAIQVAVAASLAIIAGELISPARFYWAVIAAFMVFAGTTSWGEALTKGWQRLLGTLLGVPAGMLIATLAAGDTAVSIGLIFVCLFCGFYLMQVAYSLMIFWITTILALLYGLLGQFSPGVLLLRLEETAIGAAIGVSVAVLVLPTDTREAVRDAGGTFLTTLSEVIEASVAAMFGAGNAPPAGGPAEKARQLGRDLQDFRLTAKPLAAGLAGRIVGRGSIRHAVGVLTACDHHARLLARCSDRYDAGPPELPDVVASAARRTRRNIEELIAGLEGRDAAVCPATELLDEADALVMRGDPAPRPDTRRFSEARRSRPVGRRRRGEAGTAERTRRFLLAVHSLRQIDRAIVDAALDMGAGEAEFAVAGPGFEPG